MPLGESTFCDVVYMIQRFPDIKLGDANANIQSLEVCVREAPCSTCLSRESGILALSVSQTYTDTYPRKGHTHTIQALHIYIFTKYSYTYSRLW